MGTPDFAVSTLQALCESGHEICGVITQPDRPSGRNKAVRPGPVAKEASDRGLPLYQVSRLKHNEEIWQVMRSMEPDLIVVAAFGQILPPEVLKLPRYGCINVHASLLPAYRGSAPIQHAILDGLDRTGVTIMRMDEGLDTGDMIARCEVEIGPETTGGSLFALLAKRGAELLVETLPSIFDGTAVYTPQSPESPTPYASMIKKEDGRIDWSKSAEEIELLIRAMNPWPSAFTTIDGKTLKIWRASVSRPDLKGDGETIGRILRQDARGLYIQTGQGILIPEELQLEGRRRMKAQEFLRGYVVRNPQLT